PFPTGVEATATAVAGDPGDAESAASLAEVSARTLPALTATRSDTTPDSAPVAVPGGVSAAVSATRPAAVTARTRPAKSATRTATKTGGKSDRLTARARKLLADHPDMTGAELGRRLKVSERTGSRLRNRLTAADTTEHAKQEGATS
ncbi:hypothetical protein AB0J52_08830, partial [Spirillospora sp. NPDC049652]